ncbi:UNVERIFIED_CONTAM: Tricyclene synthase Oc15, chloroplastic [Sesamum latifolium]|uniref:Tricyclene synthase Oc15, chloroplastic n=1 Tax=Sesamum latifolium TaxID=2727402 RepID=A0AAW2WMV8_9LAMI
MASCINGFSLSFRPCSLKTRPGLVVSIYGARKQKWNINVGGVAQTSGPSRLRQDCPDNFAIEYEEKIDEIRQVLRSKGEDDPSESLVLVDAIQRVGLSSYYEEEIESLIQKHYVASCASIYGYYSLRDVSLLFRLLRQHGHYISPDIDDNLSRMVIGINGWGKTLRELALMDLRKGQSVYQGELAQLSKLSEEAKAREGQLPKWYTWSMSILIDDFSLSLQRVELTASIAFIYLIHDIFDVVGTLDELTIFTEAVNKWEYAAVDMLPDYMKMCYRALLDTTNDIGSEIHKRHGHNPIDSLKESWASLCNAYLVEAKWFASGVSPTANMHLENGKVSTGVYVVLVHLFFLLGLGRGTINLPDISQLLSGVATILRLCNDLGGAKDGNEDGTDGSYIDLYMKEHPGVSVAQARERAVDIIASQWKILNKECFRLNHFSASSFKKASLNLARIVPLMYDYDDDQRLPVLEEYVKFTLFNQTNTII